MRREGSTVVTRAPRATRAVVVAWSLWALAMLGLAALAWFDHLLRRVGRADLAPLGTSDAAPYVVAVLSSATVGAVLGSRRPRHPVGWLLLALGLSVVASGVAIGYASYALLARPGALPAAVWPAAYTDFSVVLWAACLGFILLLTPTGSLPSPRWRWWATVTVAAAAVAGGVGGAPALRRAVPGRSPTRWRSTRWPARSRSSACWAGWSPAFRSRSAQRRWWSASAAPEGSSVCSSSGWCSPPA